MAISKLTYEMRMDVVETPNIAVDTYPDPKVTHLVQTGQRLAGAADLFLDTSTTPAITAVAGSTFTLVGGTLTIDLTNFDQGNLPDIDLTGKKVYMIKLAAASTNTDKVRVFVGAANGYELFGGSTGEVWLDKSEVVMGYFPEGLDAVAAADRNIDLSSPDPDAQITILVAAGT